MPIKTSVVGAEYPPYDLELSPRRLLSFAAGLGIASPRLLDDASDGGIVGFPTYCGSLEFNAFSASGKSPVGYTPEEARRGVHAGQDSWFHAPFRPDDRVRTIGRIASARQTRAGALVSVKAETRSLITDERICTSWLSQIFRGVAIEGLPRSIEEPPPSPAFTWRGIQRHHADVHITPEWPHIYAECSDIWNPIHSERRVARAAGLPDIIFQGSAVWSIAARELVNACCDGDPLRLKRLMCRFGDMVFPGDRISISIFDGEGDTLFFKAVNQKGDAILRDGVAQIAAA